MSDSRPRLLSTKRLTKHATDQDISCEKWYYTSASVNGSRAKSLPNNGFTDVGGNEEGNAGSQTIAFLQKLIKQQDYQASNKQLWGGEFQEVHNSVLEPPLPSYFAQK